MFKEIYQIVYHDKKIYNSPENHPLFIELKRNNEEKQILDQTTGKRVTLKEDFVAKRKKKCDEILATYIYFIAENVKSEYCKKVLKFILMYRECLNQSADKLNEEKKNLPEVLSLHEDKPSAQSEYCIINNGEQIPDVSNYFVTLYLAKNNIKNKELEDFKELTLHMCNWLFFNGYSCSLISFTNNLSKSGLNRMNDDDENIGDEDKEKRISLNPPDK